MINILNLFLFLCAIWTLLAFTSDILSFGIIFIGIIISLIISIFAWRLKLIKANINFLFLNFGFYRHFLTLFFISFFKSIIFLIRITFFDQSSKDCFFEIQFKKNLTKSELMVFITTLNLIPGISYIKNNKNLFTIYALHSSFFNKSYLHKIYNNIDQINDDNLV